MKDTVPQENKRGISERKQKEKKWLIVQKPSNFILCHKIKNILIINETGDEKKEESEVLSSQSMSKSEPQHTADTIDSNEMSKSAPQQTAETTTSNKMSKSAPQQTAETTASNEMFKSVPQQTADTTTSNQMSKSAPQQTAETTTSNKMSKSAPQQTAETKASNKMTKSAPQQTSETTASNKIKQTEREKSNSYPEPDQYHTMMDIEVADKYPNRNIFHKLGVREIIGFYQVQEKNLIPIIENMGDNKMIEMYETLYDQHIAVTQSIGNTVDDTDCSSLGSSIDDFQDAEENDGTLKTTFKTFVKKLIPDCLTNSN
ncbi:unnamed protein product [Mytilus coruscus]|uniref:Uncharacterized protein n=1 Tax=Mytilus coruscus TaxID=42192 RepID=A0A6J8CTP6_MYTCO|nr:unnamed protein product [Mytilus coruscus]